MLTSDFAIGQFTGNQNLDVLYARRGCFIDAEGACSNEGLTLLEGDGAGTFTEVLSWDPGGVQTTVRYDRRPEAAKKRAAELLHFPYVRRVARD